MMNVYAVHDMKAEAFLAPFFMVRDGQAMRAFGDAANDPNTMFARHPRDYMLYRIGEYDERTAELKGYAPVPLALASDVLRRVDAPLFDTAKGSN